MYFLVLTPITAHGIVLVYDASDPAEESFHNVRYWSENITKHANPACSKLLVGNKIDVKGPRVRAAHVVTPRCRISKLPIRPQIETARGAAVAVEHGMRFCETSAKDGTGVTAAFHDSEWASVAQLRNAARFALFAPLLQSRETLSRRSLLRGVTLLPGLGLAAEERLAPARRGVAQIKRILRGARGGRTALCNEIVWGFNASRPLAS